MARTMTFFNIVAGAASIIGVLIQSIAPESQWPPGILIPVCAIAGVLCLYVLFVPGSPIEKNVVDKIAFYTENVDPEVQGDVLIQRGSLRFWGFGTRTIEFLEPFRDKPHFEVLDTHGDFAREGRLPRIMSVTPHATVIERRSGSLFGFPRCNWVARGKALRRKAVHSREKSE